MTAFTVVFLIALVLMAAMMIGVFLILRLVNIRKQL